MSPSEPLGITQNDTFSSCASCSRSQRAHDMVALGYKKISGDGSFTMELNPRDKEATNNVIVMAEG